jgi:uncharacterized protein (DUF4415 family)
MAQETPDVTLKHIVDLPDGTFIVEYPDGRLERVHDQTDWARLDTLSDEEIDVSCADDPDWQDLQTIDWSKLTPLPVARKKPISIRLDEDVLSFFKRQGSGYQKRINAVLRSFVDQCHNAP